MEWIMEYGGGWLFPPGDARALASIIEDIRNQCLLRPAIPENENLYSMKSTARTMTNIYRDVVGQETRRTVVNA